MSDRAGEEGDAQPARPLRVAALVKQVPIAESLELGPDGRLRREGTPLEMNPYCRRAVAKATELAHASGGSCTVLTLGPPAAEDVLREAVAWGADDGVLVSDPAFGGSDTLATARALAAALVREGPFDLVLAGRSTVDGDTGQVGPEVAELLGLPFAAGARQMAFEGDELWLGLEQDDGWEDVTVSLPAVVSVAERLCAPAKVGPEGRAAVPAERIRRVSAADLGSGPWGDAGSPTKVGAVRMMPQARSGRVLGGDVATQVAEAVELLVARGALAGGRRAPEGAVELTEEAVRAQASGLAIEAERRPVVAALLEVGRPQVGSELLGAAARLGAEVGGAVVALVPPGTWGPPGSPGGAAAGAGDGVGRAEEVAPGVEAAAADGVLGMALGALGADEVVRLGVLPTTGTADTAPPAPEDVAAAVAGWARQAVPWAVLAPGTAFGREVAARTAAALGAGLVGDAVALDVVDGVLVAAKPAFAGALVADITCTSPVQLVTVRPGVLDAPPRRAARSAPVVSRLAVPARGRVRRRSVRRDDDLEVLARSEAVIGVGTGVAPHEYSELSALAAMLGAELAATRKVTDKGWAPRSRQVGITGRSISPRLYVAVGLSGKFNHMVGVRGAGTVLAINPDATAPVFAFADVGIVGDWHEVVPSLVSALRARLAAEAVAAATAPPLGA